jgi:hypothetical protein
MKPVLIGIQEITHALAEPALYSAVFLAVVLALIALAIFVALFSTDDKRASRAHEIVRDLLRIFRWWSR